MNYILLLFTLFFNLALNASPKVELGVDRFFKERLYKKYEGKKIGLITNQTGRDAELNSTLELFKSRKNEVALKAIFAPEHGLTGAGYAAEQIKHQKEKTGISIFSLHGATRRPTDEMLSKIDLLIYDIQDVGCRSYTYASTLFYAMEEAAKKGIKVVVLDRPNPINGIVVDGPMLDVKWRSFIGYINVPYCHGMTIGELADYFNKEYAVGCDLEVIGMRGWKREYTIADTGLIWTPTSPNIPEPDSPVYYASTGLLGELNLVSIGIGYTLPFKVVGAPWIEADDFSQKLNEASLEGVHFLPFHFKPFYGAFKGEECHGVKVIVTDANRFKPTQIQYLLLSTIKTQYPKQFQSRLAQLSETRKNLFHKANGSDEIYHYLISEKSPYEKMEKHDITMRKKFLQVRKKYLRY